MAQRPCLDCKRPTQGTRCAECGRKRDHTRGTRQQRGYDAAYTRERRRYARLIDNGAVIPCWRCGTPVDPTFDLGHCDNDRSTTHGPEHTTCNRGARGACPHPQHHTPQGATPPPTPA